MESKISVSLKQLKGRHGLSNRELAQSLGIHEGTVSRVLAGKQKVSEQLEAAAKLLDEVIELEKQLPWPTDVFRMRAEKLASQAGVSLGQLLVECVIRHGAQVARDIRTETGLPEPQPTQSPTAATKLLKKGKAKL